MKPLACCALFFVLCAASRADGQNAPSTWDGQPAQGAPPTPPPPGWYPPPPASNAPPLGAYATPYANPYGLNPQAMFMYEDEKKNALVALVIEWFVPGVGSIYADHVQGAIVTWILTVGGIATIVWSFKQSQTNADAVQVNGTELVVGLAMLLGGRIYGLVDAYSSTGDYNHALARRLGLPAGVALGVTPIAPISAGQSTAWGPALTLRF